MDQTQGAHVAEVDGGATARAAHRDQLQEWLWPELLSTAAANNLHHLRVAFAEHGVASAVSLSSHMIDVPGQNDAANEKPTETEYVGWQNGPWLDRPMGVTHELRNRASSR